MRQYFPICLAIIVALSCQPLATYGQSAASRPASQPASRPAASRPAASQLVTRVFKQGQAAETPGWTITVLSSSCFLAKRPGDTSGKERMYGEMEVRFTNTGSKYAYTPALEVEDANHNRFAVGAYIGSSVAAGNHLTRKITFNVPSRRQLRLTWTDADGQAWWIALKPKLLVER